MTVLVVGEGRETEPNYFHGLKLVQAVRDSYAVKVKRGKGMSRLQIVQEALRLKVEAEQQYDRTYCVFDTESLGSPEARKDYDDALKLAGRSGISATISNPCFEVWFLAHFMRSSRQFRDGDAVVEAINKEWQSRFRLDYNKSDDEVFHRLASLTEAAITNAKAVREQDHGCQKPIVDCNSATDVYKLVDFLLHPPKGNGKKARSRNART